MDVPVNRRTPSRCREWERNRRNKFNDAISRLGEIVKEILRTNSGSKDDNAQYPKVEIVEKAIYCLTNFIQEKSQLSKKVLIHLSDYHLEAEVLALQVKIEADNKQKENRKDAATQVFIGINKKNKSDKYVKVVMLRKSKKKVLQQKTVAISSPFKDPPKLPVLLPKSNNFNDKKGSENTIVVLPAAPYIFPQRPLLLPTMPQFVLVDQNLQTLKKSSFPMVNRTHNDITKTTMVNILPISAYSGPLSATKDKKNNKSKVEINKKGKKPKQITKTKEQPPKAAEVPKTKSSTVAIDNKEQKSPEKDKGKETQQNDLAVENSKNSDKEIATNKDTNSVSSTKVTIINETIIPKTIDVITTTTAATLEVKSSVKDALRIVNSATTDFKLAEKANNQKTNVPKTGDTHTSHETSKVDKLPIEKNKETKLPNILDTSLCENAVDGGNARLELAEEFLAASPTAAFLMSFPLVSGNRADSPAEETPNTLPINSKDSTQRRNDITSHNLPYFEKPNLADAKTKPVDKPILSNSSTLKTNEQLKFVNTNPVSKVIAKTSDTTVITSTANENPFLNLSMASLLPTSCTLSDTTFGIDFDCNINKSMPSQSSSYVSNNNFFYKSDPFSSVKSTIYSTSSISSGHEFNSFGLYPCAMEKYSTKNKPDYSNVEDNLMKIGSSRLTYDIDLGWSHKGFDFVSCTSASNTLNKDNITTAPTSYSTSYNPFHPDFHVPLVSTSNKKESSSSKPTSSYPDTITSFYSQPTNLWSEEVPFYSNNTSKSMSTRHQNYPVDQSQTNTKPNTSKQYEPKQIILTGVENLVKPAHGSTAQHVPEKYKKSPSKMHINWMTSEVRPMQTSFNSTHSGLKEIQKPIYSQLEPTSNKKQDINENSYFPISMHNYSSQPVQEELHVWPSVRPAGTTEISIEPPPINLPTLVGDLALGPHDKKRTDLINRGATQNEIQNCSNFFSVTQLMNRPTDNNNMPSRYQGATNTAPEPQKSIQPKQSMSHSNNDHNRKPMLNTESHIPQPCYVFNDSKPINSYENMNQFSHSKTKANKPDKNTKAQKNSYSAEALIRGGTCNQKLQDNSSAKFMISSQRYNDFNTPQDSSVAQVSHFPPILDYSDNSYTGQQFSGTNLYNATTNTISNSFYSNFMSGSSNLMPGNYASGPFSGDYIDYNQTTECNYSNHKYTELKMRNNTTFQQDKPNYKSSRRESGAKHKLECSKKESSKKCQSKRAKINNEVEEWSDSSQLLWQNKTASKKHGNLMSDELSFPNYVGNQMTTGQYQPEFFNSHIMSSNMQPVGHNVDRSLSSFPATSRANFNLSTIFPEITMKVQ